VVPDIQLENGESFRDVLKTRLFRTLVTFEDDRYVVVAGHQPHNGGERASIWVDLKEKRSIVRVDADELVQWEAGQEQALAFQYQTAIGSTTIPAGQLPPEIWAQLPPITEGFRCVMPVRMASGRTSSPCQVGSTGTTEEVALRASRQGGRCRASGGRCGPQKVHESLALRVGADRAGTSSLGLRDRPPSSRRVPIRYRSASGELSPVTGDRISAWFTPSPPGAALDRDC
jgi:hypothetical protein